MNLKAFAAKVAASPIARALRQQETFAPAATVVGHFKADDAHDDARLSRTSGWLPRHCTGLWRRRMDQRAGLATFEFEHAADADAFRIATATMRGMIPVR